MPDAKQPELMPEILLHPNIPKPLHGINPRSVHGKGWWDRVRQQVYAQHDFTCWACGVPKSRAKYHNWLEAHEIYKFDYAIGRVTFVRLCALCHACHNYIHDGRMLMLVSQGKMKETKRQEILAHGEEVLYKAGFDRTKPELPDTPEVPWGDWHMIIDEQKYYSCFSGYSEWLEFYTVHHGKGKLTPRHESFTALDECPGVVFAQTSSPAHVKRDLSDPKQLAKALRQKLDSRRPTASHGPVIRPASDIGALRNWLDNIGAKHGHDIPLEDYRDLC